MSFVALCDLTNMPLRSGGYVLFSLVILIVLWGGLRVLRLKSSQERLFWVISVGRRLTVLGFHVRCTCIANTVNSWMAPENVEILNPLFGETILTWFDFTNFEVI